MRSYIACAAFLLLVGSASFAHEQPLFRIISFAGEVTIDGVPVTFDQLVTPSSEKLNIGPGSYAGIITHWGLARRLGPGAYLVTSLGSHKEWLQSTGARYDGPMISPHIGSDRNIAGDYIFLRWPDVISKDFKVTITNVFDDKLFDTLLYKREIALNVRRFFESEKEIIFNLVAGERKERVLIKQATPAQVGQLQYDLERVQNHPNKKVLTIAILQLNSLYFDMAFRANQWAVEVEKDLPDDLKKFMLDMNRDFASK